MQIRLARRSLAALSSGFLTQPRCAPAAGLCLAGLALSLLAPATWAAPADSLAPAPAATAPSRLVQLFYATDREPTGKIKPTAVYGKRWGTMSFGTCAIEMPVRHRRGEVERNTERWMRGAGSPIGKVRLAGVSPGPDSAFFAGLRAAVGEGRGRPVFVFVHGFNVPFERAARFAGQIAYDLDCDLVPVLFSWPASRLYMGDEDAVLWARWDLLAFLRALRAAVPDSPIHLMSYSMGTRPMAEALTALASGPEAGAIRFDQVFFAAADVESRTFARAAPHIQRCATRVTLYVSSSDRALRSSRAAHGAPRLGQGRLAPGLLPGIDVVDVSKTRADALGHGYIFEVLADVRQLILTNAPPDARSTLVAVGSGDTRSWRLRRR